MVENFTVFFIFLVGTVAIDLFFRFGVSRYIKNRGEDASFFHLLAQKLISPINKIIYITGVYFAVSSLDLMEGTQASFNSVYLVLMFAITSWLAFRVIDCLGCFFSEKLLKHEKTSVVYFVPLVTRTLNVVLSVVLLILLLQKLGYNVTSLLAGLGITGLAVGFAAKETLSDILGSFTVVLDDVFKLGDSIIVNEAVDGKPVQGVVKIRTLDNSIVVISNHRISNMTLKNLSRRQKFRIEEFVAISYHMEVAQIDRAVELCREVLKNHPQIEDGFNVYFNQFGDTSLKIILQSYARTTDYVEYLEIREEVLLGIKKSFDAENIDFAVTHVPGF